jgi:hypothetical protein
MSLTGRHRSKDKTDEELRLEAQAKGHRQDEEPELQVGQLKPIANENFRHTERGHQKGFGKNQGKEGRDMNTGQGTRDLGSEHAHGADHG